MSDNLFADVALHAMKLSTPLAMWMKHLVYQVNFLIQLIPKMICMYLWFYLVLLLHSAIMTCEAVFAFDTNGFFWNGIRYKGVIMNILLNVGELLPILMPYYKFKSIKWEMDFGGFLQEIIYGCYEKVSWTKKIVFVLFGCLIIFQRL